MAKTNHRRSISVTAATYLRITELARVEGRSVSGIIEDLIDARCTIAGIGRPTADAVDRVKAENKARAAAEKQRDAKGRDDGGGVFTF